MTGATNYGYDYDSGYDNYMTTTRDSVIVHLFFSPFFSFYTDCILVTTTMRATTATMLSTTTTTTAISPQLLIIVHLRFFHLIYLFISFDINCILVWLTYNDNYNNYQPWSYIFLFHFFISFYINLYTSQTTYNNSEGYSDHYTIYGDDYKLVQLHMMTPRATATTTLSTAMTMMTIIPSY